MVEETWALSLRGGDSPTFWSDGINTYLSKGNTQKIFDTETRSLIAKTWEGSVSTFYYGWSDGTNFYVSNNNVWYVVT